MVTINRMRLKIAVRTHVGYCPW